MELAEKMKQYRKACRMTQKEFAKAGGITREAVAAIEAGYNKNPTMETLVGIAKAMEVTIDQLVFNGSKSN